MCPANIHWRAVRRASGCGSSFEKINVERTMEVMLSLARRVLSAPHRGLGDQPNVPKNDLKNAQPALFSDLASCEVSEEGAYRHLSDTWTNRGLRLPPPPRKREPCLRWGITCSSFRNWPERRQWRCSQELHATCLSGFAGMRGLGVECLSKDGHLFVSHTRG